MDRSCFVLASLPLRASVRLSVGFSCSLRKVLLHMLAECHTKAYNGYIKQKGDAGMELNLKMLQAEQAEATILKDLIQKLQADLQAHPESLAAESIKELLTLYREKYTRLTKTLHTAEAAFAALPSESESLLRMRYQDGLTCEQVCSRLYIAAGTQNRKHRKALQQLEAILQAMDPPCKLIKK